MTDDGAPGEGPDGPASSEDVWTFATELAGLLDEGAYEDYAVENEVT
jgi:hypothetical protein